MSSRLLIFAALFSIGMSLWIDLTCDFSKFLLWPWAIISALALAGLCRKAEDRL